MGERYSGFCSETADSYRKIIKDVFSNRNILIIALTTSVFTLVDHGWRARVLDRPNQQYFT